MRSPSTAGRWVLLSAALIWVGVWCGIRFGFAAALALAIAAVAVALRVRAAGVVMALAAAGALSGFFTSARIADTLTATVPAGTVVFVGTVVEDDGPQRPAIVRPEELRTSEGWAPWPGPPLGVGPDGDHPLVAGERVRVTGTMRSWAGTVRGDPIAGRVTIADAEVIGAAGGPLLLFGNAVRDRVRSVLNRERPAEALVSGFLIGDTSGLGARDLDALRRSGLTHFVAVSGSNVALFLGAWWIVTALAGTGPIRRFVIGVAGLAVFVVATRWEASVLRASFMAAAVLGAAAAGVTIDAWVAVGVAVSVLLLASGQLAVDAGFQLSVAATIGILVGAGVFAGRRPAMMWSTLGAASAAQVAVVPVLLWHFGTVPLMSPLANLVAAPLVTGATVMGGVAVVTGWGPAVAVASGLAGAVLHVADLAGRWPQLDVVGVGAAVGAAVLLRWPRTRPYAALGVAALAAWTVLWNAGPPAVPTVTFLAVGQGDAILIRDPGGGVALVDGGRDPLVLDHALRRHGVRRIDLLVASHGDLDHVGGFAGLLDELAVGRLWLPDHPDLGPELDRLAGRAEAVGIPVDIVGGGISYRLGSVTVEALGPLRRYLTRNDGSIVLWIGGASTVLLPGDIGVVAQRELPVLRPDILLIPHHGSASTDPEWLASTVGNIAVISVGPNTYGHPTPEILKVLERVGARTSITWEDGDISIELASR